MACSKHSNLCFAISYGILSMSSRRGGRRGIGRGFGRSLWPGDRAFQLSCCPGGRDIEFLFVPVTMGAYHLPKKSGNFGLKSNGKVIFRKFRSEIVEYLQRYSSFSVRNGTAEISLPFAKLSSFQSLIG